MMDLDLIFDDGSWEQLLQQMQPGEKINALELLTLLENEDETSLETALSILTDKHITLDISTLPVLPANGATDVRLRREQELIQHGLLLSGLEENDPLRLYLEEVAQIPVTGDISILAQSLAKGNTDAREPLLNSLLSRSIRIAQEYVGKGVLLLDLIQEAGLGLWQGIGTYTEGDIVSHCDWWIHQYLACAVLQQARSLGVGQRLRQALEDYRSVDEKLLGELGRNPTLEELAEALHISLQETQTVAQLLETVRTLQYAMQPEPEQLPQEEDQAVQDTAYFQLRQRIAGLLSGLSQREVQLITLRYGLEGGLPLQPEQVAEKLDMTPDEVVAVEAAVLKKLRDNK